MKIKDIVLDIFEKNGIFVPVDASEEELLLDSLQFVSLILALEEKFNIEINDSYYTQRKLSSFEDFVKVIYEVTEGYCIDAL